jgi:O-antigen/teichoic acid export membrane protein
MRLGQTSLIYFASRLASSAIGAIGTLYIARELGSTPLGIFQLTTGLVAWLAIVGQAGVSGAISKRVSEGQEVGAYTAAGGVTVGALFAMVALLVILFAERVNAYVGYPAAVFIIVILFLVLTFSLIGSLLSGLHLVHVRGILSMLKTAGQSGVQIVAVFAGLGVVGLYVGHIVGFVLVILIGVYFVRDNLSQFSIPDKKHFKSLSDFAKFSWVGSLQSRMFNYTDVLVLGFLFHNH